MPANILLLDIENAAIKGYVWGLFDNNLSLSQIDRDWYLLSCAYKWLGDRSITVVGAPSHEDDHKEQEYIILEHMHTILDEADIVVGHNAKSFDVKKLNAKFIEYGFDPPSSYRIVDTLLEARKHFRLTSNKLDYLASVLGFGNKIKTDFDLWVGCMKGDEKAWAKMLAYNKKDVLLLEKVYLKMRPWMTNHPNVGVYEDEGEAVRCPKCGGTHIQQRGYAITNLSRFQRFQCQDCGGWFRGRINDLNRTNLSANIGG